MYTVCETEVEITESEDLDMAIFSRTKKIALEEQKKCVEGYIRFSFWEPEEKKLDEALIITVF